MRTTPDELAEILGESTRRAAVGPDCPAPEALIDAVAPDAPGPLRERLAEHLIVCADCAEEYRVLREIRSWSHQKVDRPRPLESAPGEHPRSPWMRQSVGPRHRRRRALGWAAVAAVVAGLIAIPLVRHETRVPHPPVLRSPGPLVLQSRIPDGQALPKGSFVLRWSGPRGARYVVSVSTPELTPLADAKGLVEPEVRVPPAALEALAPGARVFWRVEAILPDGRRAASPVFVVRVK